MIVVVEREGGGMVVVGVTVVVMMMMLMIITTDVPLRPTSAHNLYQVTLPSTQNLYQKFQRIFMFRSHCARQIYGRQSGSDVKQCLRKSV